MTIVAAVLLLAGSFFLFTSAVGLIRLPDFYSRSHAVGKSETLGALLVMLGLVVVHGLDLTSFKLLLILGLIAILNPTATHTLTWAATHAGLRVWTRDAKKEEHDLAT